MSSQATRQIRSIVGDNIKAARDAKGLKQRELGALVNGMEAIAVSRWERGVVLPTTVNLVRLAEVLERDVSWFYTDHESVAA